MTQPNDPRRIFDLKASLKRPLRTAFAAGILTTLISIFLPNYYRSEARLLPVDSKGASSLGNLAAVAAAVGVSVPSGEGSDANFVDVVDSRWLREQLIQTEFQYHLRSWPFGEDRLCRGTLYEYLDVKNMDRAVKELGGILFASRDLRSKIITLSVETRSPELSQAVVQRAQQLLDEFNLQKTHTRGGEKAAFAEARLQESRRRLNEAELVLRRFLEVNRNYQTSADPAVRLEGSRLENEFRLRQQLVTTLTLNREQALLEEKNDIPILNVLDPGNLPIDKSRPARSIMVLLAAALAGLGRWGWESRAWIRERLQSNEKYDTKMDSE